MPSPLFNLRQRVAVESGRVVVLLEEQSRLGRSSHYQGRLQLVGDWGSAWHLEARWNTGKRLFQ